MPTTQRTGLGLASPVFAVWSGWQHDFVVATGCLTQQLEATGAGLHPQPLAWHCAALPQQHTCSPHGFTDRAAASGIGKPMAHARYVSNVTLLTMRRRKLHQSMDGSA